MARPPLPPGHVRDKIVAVRLNQRSYERVETLAKSKKMKVPAYVRLALQMLVEGTLLIR